jgi:hypothetical protein
MKAQEYYNRINILTYECNCTSISIHKWDKLMENATQGNKYKINKLVKELLPKLFKELLLNEKPLKDLSWFNPYIYYKTKTHLVLVHSSIEYFLKIN